MSTETYAGDKRVTRGWHRFLRHYLEMVAAMVVGMMVLGMAVQGIAAAAGLDYSHQRDPELGTLEMALTMSVGMVVWMRFRRHGWASTLEMVGAMIAPAAVLVPLLWSGVIAGEAAMIVLHVVMLPLMLVVMLRRRGEYTAPHRHARSA
jgi:hypothetical protein